MNVALHAPLPQFDDVPNQPDRDGFASLCGGNHPVNGIVNGIRDRRQPSLLMPLVGCMSVCFCDDARCSGDGRSLGLGAGHPSKTARDERDARQVRLIAEVKMEASSVEQRDGRAVNNSLRPDVHVGACRHLTVLGHTEGVHAFVIILA